jgi:hypothetical protein
MPAAEDRRPLLLSAADAATLFDLDTALASQRDRQAAEQDAAAGWAIVGRAGRLGVGTRVPL